MHQHLALSVPGPRRVAKAGVLWDDPFIIGAEASPENGDTGVLKSGNARSVTTFAHHAVRDGLLAIPGVSENI